mmetsp:Transcript_25830/g.61664  ORF Transcript_25830/g.61664 Transcript_25830/m.61664 type:complete len:201 (-) Transcript_25830:8-610(-)
MEGAPEPGAVSMVSLVEAARRAAVAAAIAPTTGPRCLLAIRLNLRSSRRSALFHRFLIWLSVRPASCLAISAHLFPKRVCEAMSSSSSAALQSVLVMFGSSWLCQRSRHCLPVRVGSCAAITDHARVPCSLTSATICTSSAADQTRRSLACCGCAGASSVARRSLAPLLGCCGGASSMGVASSGTDIVTRPRSSTCVLVG